MRRLILYCILIESDLQRRHSVMPRKMPERITFVNTHEKMSSHTSSPLLQSLKDAFTRVTSPTPEQAKVIQIG